MLHSQFYKSNLTLDEIRTILEEHKKFRKLIGFALILYPLAIGIYFFGKVAWLAAKLLWFAIKETFTFKDIPIEISGWNFLLSLTCGFVILFTAVWFFCRMELFLWNNNFIERSATNEWFSNNVKSYDRRIGNNFTGSVRTVIAAIVFGTIIGIMTFMMDSTIPAHMAVSE